MNPCLLLLTLAYPCLPLLASKPRDKLKALRYIDQRLQLVDIPPPEVPAGEALVQVMLAGICATDLEIMKGYLDFQGTLGHEFTGIVRECVSQPDLVGQRVVGEINAACGICDWCRRGLGRHCPDRTVLGIEGRDGAFAEYLALPAVNLKPIPEALPDRAAVFTEPLAAAMEIPRQVHISPGVFVLVIGDGRLAQLIVRVLAQNYCRVDAVGHHESKLRRMKGFVNRIFLNQPPPDDQYPVVIEASGAPSGWAAAAEAVAPRGLIVLKSTYGEALNFNPSPLVVDEVTVVGSRCGPFAPALAALAAGFNPTPLIDAEYPLSQYQEAFLQAGRPGTLKVLLKIGGDVR